jgi:hypothetical protein
MDKNCLYSLAEAVNCEYELGVTSEINDFLNNHDNVYEFNLNYSENRYNLLVKLKEYDVIEANLVFTSLVCFIEYSATFYIREEYDDRIEYILLSVMTSKKGFLCKVTFTK